VTARLRQFSSDDIDRGVDFRLGVEDVRREARAIEPSLLGYLDDQLVLAQEAIAKLAAVDRVRKPEGDELRRERARRWTECDSVEIYQPGRE
jgi:hypothetical protein